MSEAPLLTRLTPCNFALLCLSPVEAFLPSFVVFYTPALLEIAYTSVQFLP